MTRELLHDRLATWVCAAAIAVSLLPLLLGGAVTSRARSGYRGEDPTTLLMQAAAWLAVGFALWLVLQLAAGARHRSPERPVRLANAVAALAPWAAATASVLMFSSRGLNPAWLAVPAVIVALVIAQPDVRILKLLGGVTVALAVVAIVVGLVNPEFATFFPWGHVDQPADKAIFGTLLSWPFAHPNRLGSALVLGAPFVLYLRSTWVKAAGLAIIAGGVLWASSRSAIFAGNAFLVLALLLRALRPSARAAVVRWGAVALIGAVVATPLLTTDPEAFTQRGQVWQASLQRVGQSPLFGLGHFWYADVGRFEPDLFWDAAHGHNLMVHTVVTGGIVGLAVIGWFLVRLVRAVVAYARAGDVIPGLFVLTWLSISIIELRIDAFSMDHSWFFTVLPLIVILVGARPLLSPPAGGRGAARAGACGRGPAPSDRAVGAAEAYRQRPPTVPVPVNGSRARRHR